MKRFHFGLLKDPLDLLIDTLWPRMCVGCGGELHRTRGLLCSRCSNSLLPQYESRPVPGLDRLQIGYLYDWRMRNIILHFKFHHGRQLAPVLAELLMKRLDREKIDCVNGVLTAVPDHPSRRRERGYNPAELIAVPLAKKLEMNFDSRVVIRRLAGPHQSRLSNEERKQGLKGAFLCQNPAAGKSTLYIVDDVTHTGTTLSRLAKTAKKSGWKRVEAFCVCG